MANYIRVCGQPNKPKMTVAPYLLVPSDDESSGAGHSTFSLNDLLNLTQLKKQLMELHEQLLTHITIQCQGCRGKGFFCDLCRDKQDLLFPFSANTSACSDCCTVYHRSCHHRKHKMCTKCQRLKQKQEKQESAAAAAVAVALTENLADDQVDLENELQEEVADAEARGRESDARETMSESVASDEDEEQEEEEGLEREPSPQPERESDQP